jgi:hypothetical protein
MRVSVHLHVSLGAKRNLSLRAKTVAKPHLGIVNAVHGTASA